MAMTKGKGLDKSKESNADALDLEAEYLCRVVDNNYPILNKWYGRGDKVRLPGIHASAFSKLGAVEVIGVAESNA